MQVFTNTIHFYIFKINWQYNNKKNILTKKIINQKNHFYFSFVYYNAFSHRNTHLKVQKRNNNEISR